MNLRSIFDAIYEHTSVIGHVVWLDMYFSEIVQESSIPSRRHYVSESHRWNFPPSPLPTLINPQFGHALGLLKREMTTII